MKIFITLFILLLSASVFCKNVTERPTILKLSEVEFDYSLRCNNGNINQNFQAFFLNLNSSVGNLSFYANNQIHIQNGQEVFFENQLIGHLNELIDIENPKIVDSNSKLYNDCRQSNDNFFKSLVKPITPIKIMPNDNISFYLKLDTGKCTFNPLYGKSFLSGSKKVKAELVIINNNTDKIISNTSTTVDIESCINSKTFIKGIGFSIIAPVAIPLSLML